MLIDKLDNYQSLIFDCDGVILNSNKIKTQAFYDVSLKYGHNVAQELRDYHIRNGGVSRYKKFEYLLSNIVNEKPDSTVLNDLLKSFAREVKKSLLKCEVAVGLNELREKTIHTKWLIVSGGDQAELRQVFSQRGLDKYFNGGIFGSPDTKETIIEREVKNQNISPPSIFLGDSKYDYQVASKYGLDFLFISGWTDVSDWEGYIKENNIQYTTNISDLV